MACFPHATPVWECASIKSNLALTIILHFWGTINLQTIVSKHARWSYKIHVFFPQHKLLYNNLLSLMGQHFPGMTKVQIMFLIFWFKNKLMDNTALSHSGCSNAICFSGIQTLFLRSNRENTNAFRKITKSKDGFCVI